MARFKVIGMNWGLLFASLATRATIWFQQALHSGLALQMAKEEENGQRQILSANVRLYDKYLLTEKEGRTGKFLARGDDVLTEYQKFSFPLLSVSQHTFYHLTTASLFLPRSFLLASSGPCGCFQPCTRRRAQPSDVEL